MAEGDAHLSSSCQRKRMGGKSARGERGRPRRRRRQWSDGPLGATRDALWDGAPGPAAERVCMRRAPRRSARACRLRVPTRGGRLVVSPCVRARGGLNAPTARRRCSETQNRHLRCSHTASTSSALHVPLPAVLRAAHRRYGPSYRCSHSRACPAPSPCSALLCAIRTTSLA
jgi:hypothetical protein